MECEIVTKCHGIDKVMEFNHTAPEYCLINAFFTN